jgi:hypothetical protein
MDGGFPMEPTDEHLSLALTDDQIERLAMAVLDEFGPGLSKTQFNDVALGVFRERFQGWMRLLSGVDESCRPSGKRTLVVRVDGVCVLHWARTRFM